MKRLLISALLLLAFAVPVLGAEPKVTNWINAVSTDWAVEGNWSNGVPVDTDTVQFLDGTKALPSLGLPNAGEVFDIVIDGAAEGTAWSQDLTDFCGAGDWNYSSLTVGNEDPPRVGDIIIFNKDSAVGGAIVINGQLYSDGIPTPVANATITIKPVGQMYAMTNSWTITQPIIVETGGLLLVNGITLLANGGVNLAGSLYIYAASSVLDVGTAPINVTGNCLIRWGNGNGDILGGLNANGRAVTHTATAAGNELVCDVPGTLDLGGDATGLTVSTTGLVGTVTSNRNENVYALNKSAGTFAGNGKTWTVGAGGYTRSGTTTLSGTFTVNLSGGAGAYTQTAGTIAAASTLNVTCGTGGFTYTALTKTGTLNITAAGSANVAWSSSTVLIDLLTINSGITATATGNVGTRALVLNGTLALGTRELRLFPLADNFWTQGAGGTVTGTGLCDLRIYAARQNAGAITWGSTGAFNSFSSGGSFTLTLAGKLTTAGALNVYGVANQTATLALNGGCDITGAASLGTSTNQYGVLTLAAGQTHVLRSTIAQSGTGTANALNLGGQVRLGGNVTLAGITANFGRSVIFATSAITVNGASATAISNTGAIVQGIGGAVTFSNMDTNWTAGNPPIYARRWVDGGGNGTAPDVRIVTLAPPLPVRF